MKVKKFLFYVLPGVILSICILLSCKKQQVEEEAKIEPPIRTYIITARIDKKGTNVVSPGVGVLKGTYDEQLKLLTYTLVYDSITPSLITLRSGAKGTAGELIREIYKNKDTPPAKLPLTGSLTLNPLQERNLLKGLWFVAIGTPAISPEISGSLTLKQK